VTMKRIEFQYQVTVEIEISGAELQALLTCGEAHYDGRCRSDVGCGGFVWGWMNTFRLDGEYGCIKKLLRANTDRVVVVEASFRDLDSCAKILEVVPSDVDAEVAARLKLAMHQAMRELNDEEKRLRNQVSSDREVI
jgi:hypothetical protein